MRLNLQNCGTVVMGLKTPYIMRGDDLVDIVVATIKKTIGLENVETGDVVAVTEAVVALAQNNVVEKKAVAEDLQEKLGGEVETLAVVWPIFSRNRFAPILDCLALAMTGKKIIIQMNAWTDEQGNSLYQDEERLEKGKSFASYEAVKKQLGKSKHVITGMDYPQFYLDILKKHGVKGDIVFSNKEDFLVGKVDAFLVSNVHGRAKVKTELEKVTKAPILTLQDVGTKWSEFGLLGSNALNETELKLFPKEADKFVKTLVEAIKKETGKQIEALVYGDGAFKDPFSGVWELADPVCSPGFTQKLAGSPEEIKLKMLLNDRLKGEKDQKKLKAQLAEIKDEVKRDQQLRLGTTPRRWHDLLASLADLTSGSGDKGTPAVYIKNYFG